MIIAKSRQARTWANHIALMIALLLCLTLPAASDPYWDAPLTVINTTDQHNLSWGDTLTISVQLKNDSTGPVTFEPLRLSVRYVILPDCDTGYLYYIPQAMGRRYENRRSLGDTGIVTVRPGEVYECGNIVTAQLELYDYSGTVSVHVVVDGFDSTFATWVHHGRPLYSSGHISGDFMQVKYGPVHTFTIEEYLARQKTYWSDADSSMGELRSLVEYLTFPTLRESSLLAIETKLKEYPDTEALRCLYLPYCNASLYGWHSGIGPPNMDDTTVRYEWKRPWLYGAGMARIWFGCLQRIPVDDRLAELTAIYNSLERATPKTQFASWGAQDNRSMLSEIIKGNCSPPAQEQFLLGVLEDTGEFWEVRNRAAYNLVQSTGLKYRQQLVAHVRQHPQRLWGRNFPEEVLRRMFAATAQDSGCDTELVQLGFELIEEAVQYDTRYASAMERVIDMLEQHLHQKVTLEDSEGPETKLRQAHQWWLMNRQRFCD